jgi:molybdate transport system substrate-binding protein
MLTGGLLRATAILCLVGWLVVSACSGPASSPSNPAPVTLTISAASDLTRAFTEVGAAFEAATGTKVVFNFGSTGQLAQQIEQGAPVDVFAAANASYIDQLDAKGLILSDTKQRYANGRIVLWTRADSELQLERLEDLALPGVRRVAIANPDHAPYGTAAREALRAVGLWAGVQPKLVLGENVRQALQYAETGNVDAAIVALSLVVPAAMAEDVDGRYVLVPEDLHAPLDQTVAVIRSTAHEREARAFAEFVGSPAAREIMRKYGFGVVSQ